MASSFTAKKHKNLGSFESNSWLSKLSGNHFGLKWSVRKGGTRSTRKKNLCSKQQHCKNLFKTIFHAGKDAHESCLVDKKYAYFSACKRKDDSPDHQQQPKKPRLVFTDLQRRTLQAIFKVLTGKHTTFLLYFSRFSDREYASGWSLVHLLTFRTGTPRSRSPGQMSTNLPSSAHCRSPFYTLSCFSLLLSSL